MEKKSLISVTNEIDLVHFLQNAQYEDGTLTYEQFVLSESMLQMEDTFDLAIYQIFTCNHVLAFSISQGWLVIPEINGQLNHFSSISIHGHFNFSMRDEWLIEHVERLEGYLNFLDNPDSQEYLIILVKEYEHDKSVRDMTSLRKAVQDELQQTKQLFQSKKSKRSPLSLNEDAPVLFV